jgi:hypothetical protein
LLVALSQFNGIIITGIDSFRDALIKSSRRRSLAEPKHSKARHPPSDSDRSGEVTVNPNLRRLLARNDIRERMIVARIS